MPVCTDRKQELRKGGEANMFILNKKTGTVQECHNNDAIKACKKDTDNYAVSERREDLPKKHAEEPEKGHKKEAAGNSSPDTTKGDSGAAEGAQNGENEEGEGQQETEEGKQAAGEGAGELDEVALQAMNVATLREMAKSKGIQGYGNMNKGTLVAMILNH